MQAAIKSTVRLPFMQHRGIELLHLEVMNDYEERITQELQAWNERMSRAPSFTSQLSTKLQTKINKAIPEKVHAAITAAIRQMIQGLLTGGELTSADPLENVSLEEREKKVVERIRFYRNTSAAEGAITGAGGILLGLADFPIWLGLKVKMLCEIATLYGKDISRLSERMFLLYIFEMTFSSQKHRKEVHDIISNWGEYEKTLPSDIRDFNWLKFQQEYRDYIDIAKLLQLVPGIGAAVGAVVNHRLTEKLGHAAMNAYRSRVLS
jgi:hypothetical protein